MRTKRRKFPVFAVIITLLISAIAAVFAKTAYDYMRHQFLLQTHPLEYSVYVEKYAREFELDPFLVYAVIKTESSFNTQAVSPVGARGLMQIMEDTFDWLSRYRLFERDMVFDDMFTADENVRFGCYLLRYHLNQYNENVKCTLAAYHAGDQNVNAWLANPEFSADGETLDGIPDNFPHTEHYINKVINAYEVYIKLYRS